MLDLGGYSGMLASLMLGLALVLLLVCRSGTRFFTATSHPRTT